MLYLIKRIPVGFLLYLVPISFSWIIFRLIVWFIQPYNSTNNSLIAYGIFIVLIIFSFIGAFFLAISGKPRSWWVKFFFAIISLIQFLPILFILAPIGAFIIWFNNKLSEIAPTSLQARIKNSKVGCTVTSILAAMSAFSCSLFIIEQGNVKTAKNIDSAVMVVGHLSSGDYFITAILAMFRNWRVMVGANLWKYKIFHWFFNAVGIPIEREEHAFEKRADAVEKSKEFLINNKRSRIIVFSQGTRDRNPENGIPKEGPTSLKIGAFLIACELGKPIIPVVLIGTNKWRPPSKQDTTSYNNKKIKSSMLKLFIGYLKQYFTTGINPTIARIIYCNPISTIGKNPENVREEVRTVMNRVYLSKKRRKK